MNSAYIIELQFYILYRKIVTAPDPIIESNCRRYKWFRFAFGYAAHVVLRTFRVPGQHFVNG